MGHRLSKPSWSSSNNNQNLKTNLNCLSSSPSLPPTTPVKESIIAAKKTHSQAIVVTPPVSSSSSSSSSSSAPISTTQTIDLIATTSNNNQNLHLQHTTTTLTVPRSFVIRIQLSKMEPGIALSTSSHDYPQKLLSEPSCSSSSAASSLSSSGMMIIPTPSAPNELCTNNCSNFDNNNLNISKPIINLTFTKNIVCDQSSAVADADATSATNTTSTSDNNVIMNKQSDNEIKLNNLNHIGNTFSSSAIQTKNRNINANLINDFNQIMIRDEDGNDISNTSFPIIVDQVNCWSSSNGTTEISNISGNNNNDNNNSFQIFNSNNNTNNANNNNNNNNINININNINNLSNINHHQHNNSPIFSSANNTICNVHTTTIPVNGVNNMNMSGMNNISNRSFNINSNSSNNSSMNKSYNSNNNNNNNSNNHHNNIFGSMLVGSSSINYNDVPDINEHNTPLSPVLNIFPSECNSGLTALCAGDGKNHCCQRKNTSPSSSAYPSKWRCCKCTCRENLKKLNTTTSTTTTPPSKENSSTETSVPVSSTSKTSSKRNWANKFNCTKRNASSSSKDKSLQQQQQQQQLLLQQKQQDQQQNQHIQEVNQQHHHTHQDISVQHGAITTSNTCQSSQHVGHSACVPNHLIQTIARCTGGGGPNVILFSVNHPASSQFVVGPLEDCDERARRLRALEIEEGIDPPPGFIPQQQQPNQASKMPSLGFSQHNVVGDIGPAITAAITVPNTWHICNSGNFNTCFGTVVHSQVDFIHCLVPDLEKITSSPFYWGKMDRYEAERLLEGKPEGTFLLRDSAQEEYLFSVTFRKYGRSLHARIEQFSHKFSFDCHDPGVFTAPTVTGLLEHYKDPSCVMFFEPMLTIPLNRNFSFSLQQLCRATIVSNIKYDGINELQLPNSLKSYLKEYHYKLRVRVRDEPFYNCS